MDPLPASRRRGRESTLSHTRPRAAALPILFCAWFLAASCGGPPADASPSEVQTTSLARVLDEEEALTHRFTPDERGRIDLEGLPPGSSWDPTQRTLHFRPDFIQGGKNWTIRQRGGLSLSIEVRDTIKPPLPQVLGSENLPGFTRYHIRQTTDAFLDSPVLAGRHLEAYVTVPTAPGPHPVRLQLHGFSPAPDTLTFGSATEIIVHPQDLENTYWWGYSNTPLGDGNSVATTVPNYSQRRALHLMHWATERFDGDPERAHVEGDSMGGTGAATLGLLSAHHFAWVRSSFGQMIPRNHRPIRIKQLAKHWATPEQGLPAPGGEAEPANVWDVMDLSRAIHEDPGAQNQFLVLKHSKDDRIIHFGAVTQPSPQTGESFYSSLQSQRTGHIVAWDEGGHMVPDPAPERSKDWWRDGWDPDADERTYLRRSLAFPAFSGASGDANPGTGAPRDDRPWHPRTGYSGQVSVEGDTGWNGDPHGTLNRYLRWDSTVLVDQFEEFALPLGLSPAAPEGTTVRTDVTLRRTQRFRPSAGEQLDYIFGQQQGRIAVASNGSVTLPALLLSSKWAVLKVHLARP